MVPIEKLSGRLGNQLFRHAYLYAQMREGIIPDVYVQDPKYFDKYREEIKELFGDGIGYLAQVGIHVRRGDYVGGSFHTDLCLSDYYENAIALFPGKNFLVFSDDPFWCEDKFKGDNFQVVFGGSELEDFNQLSSCEAQIISNSSFSWWAAYLCPNPAHRVIAPRENRWFQDGVVRCRLPGEWTQI